MRFTFFLLFLLFLTRFSVSQRPVKSGLIAFYNLENLFDTIDTPDVIDEEFTPLGSYKWTGKRYHEKLDNMALAISRIGEEDGWKGGPAILGVAEIENRNVLEDLVSHPLLKESNYQIVHYDSPDLRGVDVALLYRPRFFRINSSSSPELVIYNEKGERVFTRDQLVVSGMFDGDLLHFIVCHWPSRSSGEMTTRPRRIAAATLTRHLVDSLTTMDPDSKVFVMGDLNDDPSDESLTRFLKAGPDPEQLKNGAMFNTMYPLFKKGVGSLNYRDGLNLFDQIIVTKPLTGNDLSSWKLKIARVFNSSFLMQKDGQYKGYPLRSFAGNVWQGGFSDHFPVYVIIMKAVKK